MPAPLLVTFCAGTTGPWRIDAIRAVVGGTLPDAPHLDVVEGRFDAPIGHSWSLIGTTSNTRYTHRAEASAMACIQEGLGRPTATRAALIPIKKSDAWWALAQDERRAIFEEESKHIRIGMDYLPGVARRLHHCRELFEPFDFLTWFEFAPGHEALFDDMLRRLRASAEWRYVEREVDIRLTLDK